MQKEFYNGLYEEASQSFILTIKGTASIWLRVNTNSNAALISEIQDRKKIENTCQLWFSPRSMVVQY